MLPAFTELAVHVPSVSCVPTRWRPLRVVIWRSSSMLNEFSSSVKFVVPAGMIPNELSPEE